ncbi:MAG: hypothetical protein HYW63_02420 [Candidatus Levybacteria bacterium]|nr:hypothetical protein [Candidatus Levybacteria bacterium]
MLILEKLGFTKKKLPPGISFSLIIAPKMTHYPNNPHTKYPQWNWCKDEFVPPLTNQEFQKYILSASDFRKDFLRNLNLYISFCSQIKRVVSKVNVLDHHEEVTALVALFYLFQSAMDHHYYHYDYFLDLEEYPKSPLGWHFLRMKKILTKVSPRLKKDNSWVEKEILHLLSRKGEKTITNLKPHTTSSELKQINESYKAVQIFLKVQQEEEKLFVGNNFNSPVFKAGYGLWDGLGKAVKKTDNKYFKDKKGLLKILDGDPIWGTRKILVDRKDYIASPILNLIQDEIIAWAK